MLNKFDLKAFLGLKTYVSEIDHFLTTFDRTHPSLSSSQCLEKEKYQRIYRLRDNPAASEIPQADLWENF